MMLSQRKKFKLAIGSTYGPRPICLECAADLIERDAWPARRAALAGRRNHVVWSR